jgi:hypothetical protein
VEGNLPDFEALSYAWGSTECYSKINVGTLGKDKLPIPENLEIGLRYLRYEDKPRILWIDAICVNQQNLDERGYQVRYMSKIYAKVKRVVIWLGQEGDRISTAINLLKEISFKIEVNWELVTMKPVVEVGLGR